MAAKTFLNTALTICAVLFLLAQLTFAELPRYEFIDLGTLGGFYSCAYSINSSGQIVGMAANSSNCVRATLFDPTGSGNNIDLGTIGGCCGVARSINDRGQIVGWSSDSATGWSKATLFDPTGNGDNVDLGSLGVGLSGAYSVNNNGHIVGYAFNSSSYSERATLFDPTGNGENIDLSTPDGSWSEVAYSINDKAQIVGKAQKSADYVCATLFDPNGSGNNIDLGTLGGSHSAAHSINDTGQIVGIAENSSGYDHATLFDPSGNADNTDLGILDVVSVSTTSLMKRNAQITHSPDSIDVIIVRPELPKYPATKAFCINDNGQIVGYYREALAPYKATLFDPTGNSNNLDLNTLLIDPNCGWTLEYAYSINNSGWIVGQGMNPAGEHHAYILIPILPKIIYVDDDATGANNGSSWADAYNFLQDALAAAWSGDEILVAQGIYKPDQGVGVTPGDREATFQLLNGVTIKGGYAGLGQTDPNARDIKLYETILSGDLAGNDGPDFSNNGDNSYHVVIGSGTDASAALDGFTVTGGNANGSSSYYYSGGGVYNQSGRATIVNCTFSGNSARDFGGGMFNNHSNPTLSNCTFTCNMARGGGGMFNSNMSSPVLTNCTFSENIAVKDEGSFGGGMYNDNSSPILTNCTFTRNLADVLIPDHGGGEGGGMYNRESSPTLTNCTFSGNTALCGGGGMGNRRSSPTLNNCIFTGNLAKGQYDRWGEGGGMYNSSSNPKLKNCTFTGNTAGREGGGINCFSSGSTITNCNFSGNIASDRGGSIYNYESSATIANCTFSGNAAGSCGAGICNVGSDTTIINCILWGDTAAQGSEIYLALATDYYGDQPSTINVDYSDVDGGATGVYVGTDCTLNWGTGNIDLDPCFVSPGYWDSNGLWVDGDYHLLPDSPCIDAGDPNYIPEPDETDLYGNPRVINGRIDMGAYEAPIFAEAEIEPDTLNLQSKGKWISAFIQLPEDYNVADIDPNSVLLASEIKPEKFWLTEDNQIAIAKFDRQEVQSILDVGEIELTITGQLTDGTVFEGTDTIKVIDKAGKK